MLTACLAAVEVALSFDQISERRVAWNGENLWEPDDFIIIRVS